MRKMNRILALSFVFAVGLALTVSRPAQAVSYTGPAYTQNFDGMGTGTTISTGWSVWWVGNNASDWSTSIQANGAAGTETVQRMTQFTGSTSTTRPVGSVLYDNGIGSGTRDNQAYNIARQGTTDGFSLPPPLESPATHFSSSSRTTLAALSTVST